MQAFIHKHRRTAILATGLALLVVAVIWKNNGSGASPEETANTGKTGKTNRTTNRNRIQPDPGHRQTMQESGTQSSGITKSAQNTLRQTPSPAPRRDRAILHRAGNRHHPQDNPHTVQSSLARILGSTSLSARHRAAAIEALRSPNGLTPEDRETAVDYLRSDPPEGTTPGQHHWIIDELITTLRADGADNTALTRTLAGLYNDTTRHTVVRDYALQHLGHLTHEGGDMEIIRQTLLTAIREKQGTIAGTALLAIHNADRTDHGTPVTGHSLPLAIAKDQTYDLRPRITALQIAGKQQDLAAVSVAAEISADTAQPTTLRLAAIATLADLHATGQQQIVRQLSNSSDRRIRTAAKEGLRKLKIAH